MNDEREKELQDLVSKFQRKYHTNLVKAERYAAKLYDIEHKDDPPPTHVTLKAEITFLKGELNKIVIERDKFKNQAKTARGIITNLRYLLDKLKGIDLDTI